MIGWTLGGYFFRRFAVITGWNFAGIAALVFIHKLNQINTQLDGQRLNTHQTFKRAFLVQLFSALATLDNLPVWANTGWATIRTTRTHIGVIMSALPCKYADNPTQDEEGETKSRNQDKQKQ